MTTQPQPPTDVQPTSPYPAPDSFPAQHPMQGFTPPMTQAVTKSRKRTSHGLHLFLTIITFGAWGLVVWLPLTLWHAWGPRAKAVTQYR